MNVRINWIWIELTFGMTLVQSLIWTNYILIYSLICIIFIIIIYSMAKTFFNSNYSSAFCLPPQFKFNSNSRI